MGLSIQLLGGFSVVLDNQAIVPATRKACALLAILAHRPGVPHQRNRLADMLWPRSQEAQARASLRQALAQLRRDLALVGAFPIEARADVLRLLPDTATVDVAAFDQALEQALTDGATLERAADAAALYRGDFLDGFGPEEEPFEEWRRTTAAGLRARALQGLGRVLDRLVETGDAEAAMTLGERLLAIEPTGEETHQALMRLHIALGAPGAATRQYERCRTALKEQLGMPPSAGTEALRQRIRVRPLPEQAASAAGAADPVAIPAIAVLPFANLSEDPEQAWFTRSFTEDLLGELARFRSLRVTSAQSAFTLGDPAASPQETAERLGVRYLLRGSVRRGGDGLRIAAELLDAVAGRYLWTQRYDLPLAGVFDAQDAITAAVASALAVRIDADQLQHARRKAPADLRAYECWLRGVALLRSGMPDDQTEARGLFERALALEPGFARAEAGLSLSYFNEWTCLAWDRWAETEARAFAHARRAVALDQSDHIAHFVLGRVLLYRRDFSRAQHHLEHAEALNPNDADALVQLAMSHAFLGDAARGLACAQLARQLNPFHDDWYYPFAGTAMFVARRLEEALELGLKAPEAATDMHAYFAACCGHLGRTAEARYHADQFLERFHTCISPFERGTGLDEPMRWLVHVNPMRRDEDQAYFLDGLARAGLAVPPTIV